MSSLSFSFCYIIERYSYYSGAINAPQEFSTRFPSLDYNLWEHVKIDGLMLKVVHEPNGEVLIQVINKETKKIYEKVQTSRQDIQLRVQFSAKPPILSCKYLTDLSSGIQLLRRFQIELGEKEFKEVYQVILFLGAKIKSAKVVSNSGSIAPLMNSQPLPNLWNNVSPTKVCQIQTKHKSVEEEILETQNLDPPDPLKYPIAITNTSNYEKLQSFQFSNQNNVLSETQIFDIPDVEQKKELVTSVTDSRSTYIHNYSNSLDNTQLPQLNDKINDSASTITNNAIIQHSNSDSIKNTSPSVVAESALKPQTTGVTNRTTYTSDKGVQTTSITVKPVITKRIIKQKLKDKKFMRRVRKVESYFILIDKKKSRCKRR